MLARQIRTGLMSAVVVLGVALSGQAMADITVQEATALDAKAKATLTQAISQKEYPSSWCRGWTDQNIPLGQRRMAFQAALDRLHGFFAQCNALFIHLAAQLHDRMDAFPHHTLGPFQHSLDIDQLRPIPV